VTENGIEMAEERQMPNNEILQIYNRQADRQRSSARRQWHLRSEMLVRISVQMWL
jgi:hypothetical protein